MAHKRVPEGRLGRLARLAAAGARSGAGLVLSKRSDGAAESTAQILGTLRGLATKLGQMASYVDGVIPEEHRDAYESAMKKLRAAAPTSSPQEIAELVESELGAPIDDLFSEFTHEPFASASIGQVHEARLLDGREVAVKVQHPGITKALESDLANAGIVEQMMAVMGTRKLNSKAMLEVMRARFREELDYGLEAERQIAFAKLHADHPAIRIPKVIADRSTKRVLCTELVRGTSFDDACNASEAERRAWANTLWRFVFKGNLVGGMFNADPHPGNYFFHEDGAVTFIDFGCVQLLEDWHRLGAVDLHLAAMKRDEALFRKRCAKFLGTKGGAFEDELVSFVRACFTPLFSSPFKISRPFVTQIVEQFKGTGVKLRKIKEEEISPVPADFFFMNRLQFGFYSVLARLDVEVDYSAVERTFLTTASIADARTADGP
jgi:predicted unusual protein kinase regulating ubiquinone biosynthesis (AarF/ABC1/UbiB family)